jgi:phosphonate transport system substrate-binding protein
VDGRGRLSSHSDLKPDDSEGRLSAIHDIQGDSVDANELRCYDPGRFCDVNQARSWLSLGAFTMRARLVHLGSIAGLFLVFLVPAAVFASESPGKDTAAKARPRAIKIGAVAYSPSAVTVFEEICRYLVRNGLPADYVLYSNYDALVDALHKGQVDIAWNTPLAHAQFHLKAGGKSQTLAMRDVDCNFRVVLVARSDSGIQSLADLKGRTLVLGSEQAAEAYILPVHFLARDGVNLSRVKVKGLDGCVDLRGNPCSSEVHVLKAVSEGAGQAGVIGERYWNHLSKEQPDQVSGLKAVWVSPAFSHCVFTAHADFDKAVGSQFAKLMMAMNPNDPTTAEAMRLEGTKHWVAGSQDGFQELFKALREKCGCCCGDSSCE